MDRYIRQTILPFIGNKGQSKLLESHICIIGCGGLGNVVAPYLAGAGIGKLTLVDGDRPDKTNLHRQIIFSENELNAKSQALATHCRRLNSGIDIVTFEEMISKENIKNIIDGAHLVVECTDDIMAKYLVNDYCHLHHIPMVYGAIHKVEGYVSVFENTTFDSIHLRDVFPRINTQIPSCSEVGVINTIAGMIGILQANEVLKYILNIGSPLIGKMLSYNILYNEQIIIKLKKIFNQDIHQIFQNYDYQMTSCPAKREISFEDILQNRSAFKIISILENWEHTPIDEQVIHIPLQKISTQSLSAEGKTIVFYCMSGKRSSILVDQILKSNPDANVWSLKGGLLAVKKTKKID